MRNAPALRIFGLAIPLWCGLFQLKIVAAQPVLHEPVSAPTLSCAGGVCQRVGEPSGALPDAVVSDDGLIGAPLGGRNPHDNEPIFSNANQSSPLAADLMRGAPPPGHDPPPVRRARVAPDSETGPEPPGERAYHETFNPAVFPYKRMTALDAVDESGVLYISDRRYRELPMSGNRLIAGRDPFYGSLVVDFSAQAPVALPTPAAGLRLLSYQTTPEQPLAFYRDAADNLYAIAARSGRYRLVFLVDAEQRYFAGPLFSAAHRGVRLDALPPPPPVPRAIRRDADKVLRHIGLRPTPSSDYADLVGRLVAYFRSFQMAELPPEEDEDGNRSSLYLRIALSQRGVCRHRSYAFVITALAAGIPVRYVENELHVFVEVFIPAVGDQTGYWRRINLGGAPLEQRVFGGENREAYQEKGGDPFDRPAPFTRAAPPHVTGSPKRPLSSATARSGATGGGSESSPDAAAGEGGARTSANATDSSAKEGAPDPARSSGSGSGKSGDTPGNKPGNGPGTEPGSGGTGDGEAGENESIVRSPSDRVGETADARPSVGGEPLVVTHVNVSVGVARRIYRGAAVPVHGSVRADRGSAANLEVLLVLAAPQPLVLGRTVTHDDGSFATEVEIPGGAPLGHFQLVARVRGDDKRRGSTSGTYNHLSRATLGELDFAGTR